MILYSSRVEDYLSDLIDILFDKEYFGFEESAKLYVRKIYDVIEEKISESQYKFSPAELRKHGESYISYSPNKRTTWYIFFTQRGNRYLIKYITNNHVADARFL